MGYSEKMLEKIDVMEQRAAERRVLWQGIIESFEEKEGADGVANNLAQQVADTQKRFDAMLAKLEGML